LEKNYKNLSKKQAVLTPRPPLYSLCSYRGGDFGMRFELVIRVEF